MQPHCASWLLALAGAWAAAAPAVPQAAQEVLAGAPTDLSVTVYRAPYRGSGTISLDYLGGFALIRETRSVRLPAGLSRVRFEGVADGIEPVSAIITGLADGVVEKNLDARLLSPATLIATAAGKPVTLLRKNPKTGIVQRLPATILTGRDADGVVFQTPEGVEALRCAGLPESIAFADATGLSATPTLSVAVRTSRAVTQQIQLSYLARGFDWAADYTATLSRDEKTLDLGAWVTLANGNGVGFAAASTQVVAGRLNRENGEVEPLDAGGPVLARCWPAGKTSDPGALLQLSMATAAGALRKGHMAAMAAPAALMEVTVTGARLVSQEQLGDLKLYRVPERTTVASRQSKQVRLLDRTLIPVHCLYSVRLESEGDDADPPWVPASVLLRTRNDTTHHLGLPLPSGRVVVMQSQSGSPLFLNQANLRDLAIDEEFEIDIGHSSDVQVRSIAEEVTSDPAKVRTATTDAARRVEISNARDSSIEFELVVSLNEGARIIRADHPLTAKNGRPLFKLTIPANSSVTVRYRTRHVQARAVRH